MIDVAVSEQAAKYHQSAFRRPCLHLSLPFPLAGCQRWGDQSAARRRSAWPSRGAQALATTDLRNTDLSYFCLTVNKDTIHSRFSIDFLTSCTS